MPRKMIVVESRAKTQSIGKIVGNDYNVTSCLGHVYDLPEKELGIDVRNGFKPQYKVVSGRSKLIKQLQKSADGVEEVILATDPDREGESIAWHLSQLFPDKKVSRMTFNEITAKAVREALKNLRAVDMKLVNAQQARRVMDRLVGYKISPLLWRILNNSKLSAGRVQSVALRMICDREEEVKKFVPEEYWNITGLFARREGAKEQFEAQFVGTIDEEIKVVNEAQAGELIEQLGKCAYRVREVKRKTERRRPMPPFTTSSLQQESSRRLNFSASKTMLIAQQLYEGVELGETGSVGLITYMRTDSSRVSDDAREEAAGYIRGKFGADYLPEKPNVYKSKPGVQDAHEAIRPSSVLREPKTLVNYLTKDQHKLYRLIWMRFVASQMAPAVVDVTRYDIDGDEKFLFRATGSVVRFDGHTKIFAFKSKESLSANGDDQEKPLPEMSDLEKLDLSKLDPKQHFTKPPSRFTEASLVRELEERGIGRPSTYVPIIETLKKRDYTRIEKRSFRPTKWGMIVNKLLTENFTDILDYNFTARMEKELDQVESGKKDWQELVGEFYGPFEKDIEKASRSMKFEEKVEEKCPKCGSELSVKTGKYGIFLGCTKYPECDYTKPYGEEGDDKAAGGAAGKELSSPELSGEKCEKCGSDMVVRTGRYGKFIACSGYPKCRNIKSRAGNVKCPREGCGGNIVPRRGKNRRTFYGCSNYPKCDFISWSRPVENESCPDCGGMLVHFSVKNQKSKKCINEKCGKMIPVEDSRQDDNQQDDE